MVSLTGRIGVVPQAPQADVDLDIRSLRAWLVRNDDEEPELVLRCDEGTDDEQTVTVGYGVGGVWEESIAAAERVAECFLDYAETLRRIRPRPSGRPVGVAQVPADAPSGRR